MKLIEIKRKWGQSCWNKIIGDSYKDSHLSSSDPWSCLQRLVASTIFLHYYEYERDAFPSIILNSHSQRKCESRTGKGEVLVKKTKTV